MADRHPRTPENQQRPPPERVHRVQTRCHAHQLRDIKNTTKDQPHIVPHPHRLEQRRRVVDQRVDPNELLEEHDHNAHHRPPPIPLPEAIGVRNKSQLDAGPPAPLRLREQVRMPLLGDLAVESDFGPDVEPLGLHARVVRGHVAQLAEGG